MQIYNTKRVKALQAQPSRENLNSKNIPSESMVKQELESENERIRSKIEAMEGGPSRS